MSFGTSTELLKEQGSYNLVQNRGDKGPVLRPRCIGSGEGPNPKYYSILYPQSILKSVKIFTTTLTH